MAQFGVPALYALFVWWFTTLVILYLDGLPRRTFRWSMLGATLLLAISLYGLAVTGPDTSVGGAYAAFSFGLLVWAWQQISFYMGFVTGPRKHACQPGCSGWRHAIQTSLYHEVVTIGGALIVALTWHQPNQVGAWTFAILWLMHQSAKLNVFFGVPNITEDFLPEHLGFLKSFFTKKPMNLFFPVSVTASIVAATLLIERALAHGASAFAVTALTLLCTLVTLAVLEHWFLVLPLPAETLWNWGMKSRAASPPMPAHSHSLCADAHKSPDRRRIVAGFEPQPRSVSLGAAAKCGPLQAFPFPYSDGRQS